MCSMKEDLFWENKISSKLDEYSVPLNFKVLKVDSAKP